MHKFKVGDKIRVIKDICNCTPNCGKTSCIFLNEVGTISAINNINISVKYFVGMDDRCCSGFSANMLELMEAYKKNIKVYGIVKFLADTQKGGGE